MTGAMKDTIVVTEAKYLASAVRPEQYPEEMRPSFVFLGRSNVGKSSLINSLTRVRNLARVSGQPGKTQTLNFFGITLKEQGTEKRQNFYLVDLPGYGYAKTGRGQRQTWAKFIADYLGQSTAIRFVCQLIDIRHGPLASDQEMFAWLAGHGLPVLVVATKADKLAKGARERQVAHIRQTLQLPEDAVLPYSSVKSEGRSELLDAIWQSLLE